MPAVDRFLIEADEYEQFYRLIVSGVRLDKRLIPARLLRFLSKTRRYHLLLSMINYMCSNDDLFQAAVAFESCKGFSERTEGGIVLFVVFAECMLCRHRGDSWHGR